MTPSAIFRTAGVVVCLGFLAACGAPPDITKDTGTSALASEIAALGPGVSEAEAARAAQIAITYSTQLARDYGVTDPPLVHNSKVNLGLRPRGLCYHWADDLEARLRQENLQTLGLHRAIANADNTFRIQHSTVIVAARGAGLADGIVLDPWRQGGDLFWAPVASDTRYDWVPRESVFAERRAAPAVSRAN